MADFPTKTEANVMQILRASPWLYGLQIVGRGANRGSVYVLLQRLEEKGMVDVDRSPATDGHPGKPRPLYRISKLGKRVLRMRDEFNG